MAGNLRLAARVPARLTAGEGRRFGLTLAAAFTGLAAFTHWRGQAAWSVMAVAAVLLLAAAVTLPHRLAPVYRFWMGLAAVMSRVTTPLFMGVVYFLLVTPTGVIRRLAGHSPIARKRSVSTFWASRSSSRRPQDMEHQF